MSQGAAGYEVAQLREKFEPVIREAMALHTARNGCEWPPGTVEVVLCDIAASLERQEICVGKKAA